MQLRDQLQATLGSAYTIERELGGGGMSRVFVARDEHLRRSVVVKVLPPELVAGVNAERFDREIELAAGLQHPHIVPVLSAGQTNGVPYYTMPFVEGDSLRALLLRGDRLPMTDVIGILRDVAKALAYAHERGIVHRDIKPDNVLLSGGSAVVTDFGIAKAISASRTVAPGGTLTQIGTSIGTPAYMAPEQAAADPATDHRADIYSFGCVAYELLAGRPPFVGKTPQKLLAAQMGEVPQSITELRVDTPASLASLVMQCLAKDADARPQRAADIVRVLETTTSGGGYLATPMVLAAGRGVLQRALLVYVAAFVIVAIVAKAAIVAIGLPDWVFPGALVVMALGLPVILFTAYVHRTTRRAFTATPTYTPNGTPSMAHGTMANIALKASPHVSWRRTTIGGAVAVGAFVLLIGGYMTLRAMGIGPSASLFAAGTLEQNEKLLVADFPNPKNDSTLGAVVTDAFRTALGESQSVTVLQQTAMRDVLRRMQKSPTEHVDYALAREIASREGIKAVLDGNLIGVGGKYLIALRLMSPQNGEELAHFSGTADNEADLLPTIDKLAKNVRAKIGESLKKVQGTPPLEQVTTPSLEALRKYVQGSRAGSMDGDFAKGTALIEEAIALDTGFAMAYRKLAVLYGNSGNTEKSTALLEKAFAHRDRLSDAERYLLIGSYYQLGMHQDAAKAQQAYEQLLDIQPQNTAALNNLGNLLRFKHEWVKAGELYDRAIRSGNASAVHYANMIRVLTRERKLREAEQVARDFAAAFPTNPAPMVSLAEVKWAEGQFDSAAAVVRGIRNPDADPLVAASVHFLLGSDARLHGKLGDSRREIQQAWSIFTAAHITGAALQGTADSAVMLALVLGDKTSAVRMLEEGLARHPLTGAASSDPYVATSIAYSIAGRPDRARAVLAQWEESRKSATDIEDDNYRHAMRSWIAIASGKYDEAASEARAAAATSCDFCVLPTLAQAYDLGGQSDSAIAVFNRFIDLPVAGRDAVDGNFLAGAHKRLGELYEAKGNNADALKHYNVFLRLWKNADPELQPKVAEVRQRVDRLSKLSERR